MLVLPGWIIRSWSNAWLAQWFIGSRQGRESRARPLGITIAGGLIVSQMLTLYTTPAIYLLLDKLHRVLWGTRVRGEWPPSLMRALRQ